MWVRFARGLSTERTVTIRSSGITGGPVVIGEPDAYFASDTAVRMETRFLDAQGRVVGPLAGVEPLVTPADTLLLRYSGKDFEGALTPVAMGQTHPDPLVGSRHRS